MSCISSRRLLRCKSIAAPLLITLLVAILTQGCGSVTRELQQVDPQQANIETSVKAALIDEQSINAASIQVSMDGEAIVLSGFVGSQTESDSAERLARQSTDGLSVINSLEIR